MTIASNDTGAVGTVLPCSDSSFASGVVIAPVESFLPAGPVLVTTSGDTSVSSDLTS